MVIDITIRERIEKDEELLLSDVASLSKNTLGREIPEIESEIRTEFQRDRDRIIHSKAFRRLKHKTQVFIAPEQDHYRTRLTHTLEVSQIARTIARALRLNEDLVEAISLGHDLGHTPFGQSGEEILNKLHPNGFKHYEQSIRVVQFIEQRNNGLGLNLTWEVLDGIRNHSGDNIASTEEGKLIKYADRIAYINHDIDDSIRAEIISEDDLPQECKEYFTSNKNKRLSKMINDIILYSEGKPNISMSDECWLYTTKLREWMFENIYTNSPAKLEEKKTARIVCELYKYYTDFLKTQVPADKIERIVVDYISSMTDQYAIEKFKELFIPKEIQATNKDDAIFRLIKKDCYLNVN